MTPAQSQLLAARRLYSHCAKRLEITIQAAPTLTKVLSERIAGIGVACDWVRRAAEMDTISFMGNGLNDSPWQPSFVETTRFGFAWYGMNAIFSRDALLGLLGSSHNGGELERFRIVWNVAIAVVPSLSTTLRSREVSLRSILAHQTTPRMPDTAPGASVTTLCAVVMKYVPSEARTKGKAAKTIADAANSGNLSALDIPILLYAFRNWSVHGSALHGSFGSRPRFRAYVELLLEALADVHVGTAKALLSAL